MKRCASGTLIALALLAGGCGGDEQASQGGETSTSTPSAPLETMPVPWTGPPQPEADGTMSTRGFNEYAQTLPESKRDPRSLAVAFLRPKEPYTINHHVRPGGAAVEVFRELEDDSVREVRYTLEFVSGDAGELFLKAARADYKCQAGRGHQDFSAQLCL